MQAGFLLYGGERGNLVSQYFFLKIQCLTSIKFFLVYHCGGSKTVFYCLFVRCKCQLLASLAGIKPQNSWPQAGYFRPLILMQTLNYQYFQKTDIQCLPQLRRSGVFWCQTASACYAPTATLPNTPSRKPATAPKGGAQCFFSLACGAMS